MKMKWSTLWRPIELDVLYKQQVFGHIAQYDLHVSCNNSLLLNVCNFVSSMLDWVRGECMTPHFSLQRSNYAKIKSFNRWDVGSRYLFSYTQFGV